MNGFRHHVALCLASPNSRAWMMVERTPGGRDWHPLSQGNPPFRRLFADALQHCRRTWDLNRFASEPDLTVTFSSAEELRVLPPAQTPTVIEGALRDEWATDLTLLAPLGDAARPEIWARVFRPAGGTAFSGGIFNAGSLDDELAAVLPPAKMVAFEMRDGELPVRLDSIWIRPAIKLREVLPHLFPMPVALSQASAERLAERRALHLAHMAKKAKADKAREKVRAAARSEEAAKKASAEWLKNRLGRAPR